MTDPTTPTADEFAVISKRRLAEIDAVVKRLRADNDSLNELCDRQTAALKRQRLQALPSDLSTIIDAWRSRSLKLEDRIAELRREQADIDAAVRLLEQFKNPSSATTTPPPLYSPGYPQEETEPIGNDPSAPL